MVEVEMADGDDIDRIGVEARITEARQYWFAGHSPLSAVMLVHPLADPGFDQHAPGGCLDKQAIQGLVEHVRWAQLRLDELLPHDPRHGAERGPRVSREPAGLDQPDARPTAQLTAPVDGLVQRLGPPLATGRPFESKSR